MSISIQENIFALATLRITGLRENTVSLYGIHYMTTPILNLGF